MSENVVVITKIKRIKLSPYPPREPTPACFAEAGASVFLKTKHQTNKSLKDLASAVSRSYGTCKSKLSNSFFALQKQATRQKMGLRSSAEALVVSFYYNSDG